MRGIKAGNFMVYRNSLVCVICRINSDTQNNTIRITGMDSNGNLHTGTDSDWSSVMGRKEDLKEFSSRILGGILDGKKTKR